MRANDAAAETLQELADLVAISGGDQYRVRAYEKAARSVAGYPLDLDTLDRKALMEIPAVGGHIADKLLELGHTGRIAALEELYDQLRAGLRTLLGIPGLGPKRPTRSTWSLAFRRCRSCSPRCNDERLRLKGWGETSERNLARAIQRMQELGVRMPLAIALDIAEELVAQLAPLPQVTRVDYAGSVRRMCDTVGDIDLLVAADADPGSVMDYFCAMPSVDRVLAHGPTKSSVVTTKGIQVDLRVVPAAVWGAALQYFTGSNAHNIRIRALAVRAGLKLSEYGLFGVEGDQLLVSTDEAEIYAKLGLPWIPPTLREDCGYIQAAIEGHHPDLVEVADIVGDLHIHTNLTDGLADLDDMVAAAAGHGYRYCAITDHAPMLAMQRMTRDRPFNNARNCPHWLAATALRYCTAQNSTSPPTALWIGTTTSSPASTFWWLRCTPISPRVATR